ncbi:MAG: SDR family oxidoreductase [Leeuwenhoekiella sp.]
MSKHVIVTGTSRGIGFELAQLFAKNDWKVLALSRNDKPIDALKDSNISSFPFNIGQAEDFQKVAQFVSNNWDGRVDVMIHNAGALVNKPFAETTAEDFKKVYEVNVFGVAQLTKTVLPFMQKGSHVLTVSSMGGIQGSAKFPGLAAYSSSKGAVITLSELLAEEYKEAGITFNVLALGAVQTEMLEEAFPGYQAPLQPEEMAEYIYDFSVNGNKYYNGKVLQVSASTP